MYVYTFYDGFHAFFLNLGSHNSVAKQTGLFFLLVSEKQAMFEN